MTKEEEIQRIKSDFLTKVNDLCSQVEKQLAGIKE